MKKYVELGCGLIGIGRKWNLKKHQIPNDNDVSKFLAKAFGLEISFFDTVLAYELSEKRLGNFLAKIKKQLYKIIPTGTSNTSRLLENMIAFNKARESYEKI